jgi:hypothetical protein
MSNIIDVTDPRGKKVICTKGCWYGHVLERHPFLRYSLKTAKKTIEKPNFINSSGQDSQREVYYRKTGDKYFRIVIESNAENGEVRSV